MSELGRHRLPSACPGFTPVFTLNTQPAVNRQLLGIGFLLVGIGLKAGGLIATLVVVYYLTQGIGGILFGARYFTLRERAAADGAGRRAE